MKKIICAVLTVIMCMGTLAFANEAELVTAEAEIPAEYVLSLDEAIAMALTDNPQLNAADINIKSCETAIKAAYEARAKFGGMVTQLGYRSADFGIFSAEKQLELAEKSKEQLISKISYDVTQKYYNYKLMLHLIESAEASLNLAKENLKVVNANYELGRIAKLENDNAALSVQGCEVAKNNYVRSLSLAKEALKIALNIENDALITLTDDINFEEYSSDVAEDAKAALESRYDITALKAKAEISKENFNLTKSYSADNTANYQSAYSSYIQDEYTYTNTKKQLKIAIFSAYNSITAAKENLEIAEMTYDIHARNYEAGKLKFQMGTISNIALTDLLNKQSEAGVEVENAKLNYKLAVEKYKYEISIGL